MHARVIFLPASVWFRRHLKSWAYESTNMCNGRIAAGLVHIYGTRGGNFANSRSYIHIHTSMHPNMQLMRNYVLVNDHHYQIEIEFKVWSGPTFHLLLFVLPNLPSRHSFTTRHFIWRCRTYYQTHSQTTTTIIIMIPTTTINNCVYDYYFVWCIFLSSEGWSFVMDIFVFFFFLSPVRGSRDERTVYLDHCLCAASSLHMRNSKRKRRW